MARRKQTDEPLTIEKVIQWAAILSPGQRRELIDGLLALDELSEDSDRTPNTNDGNGGGTGRGSIERKMINGCGPYLYLRYWSGGKHRSIYLGKGKD
jgi:hypothetical protein